MNSSINLREKEKENIVLKENQKKIFNSGFTK